MRRPRTWLVAAGVAAATPAAASPLGDPAIERAVFAGSTEASAMSLSLNPASLAAGSGSHLVLTGAATVDRVAIDRRTIDPDSGALAAGPSVTDVLWSPGGSIGAYTVGSQFAAAVQVQLPTAEEMVDGGAATAYHSLGGDHRELDWFQIGGAYRWRGLAFGATLSFVDDRIDLRFARDTALEAGRAGLASDCDGAPCGLENPAAREVYDIDATSGYLHSRANAALTAGVLARIGEAWWVGASYALPQGLLSSVTTTGRVTVTRAPRDGGGHVSGDASVRFKVPQWLRLGARGRITPGLDLVVEGRWSKLSSFSQYDVRMSGLALADAGVPEVYPRARGLRDDLMLQVGVEQVDVGQRWVLGGRLGVDTGATAPGRLSPLQVYPTSVTADLGVQLRIAPAWTVQLGYGLGWAPTRDTGRGAYDPIARLDCIDSGYDIDTAACRAVREGYGLPTASGTYGRVDNVVRAELRVAWP